jgi:hypothetical protein
MMNTIFNYGGSNLFLPTGFREDFNHFAPINATQAWSLFFTASQADTALGVDSQVGQRFTTIFFAIAISSTIGVLLLQT